MRLATITGTPRDDEPWLDKRAMDTRPIHAPLTLYIHHISFLMLLQPYYV